MTRRESYTIPLEQYEAEASRIRSLTFRERTVCIHAAEGLTNKQIGQSLFISAVTVRHHLSSVFRKLDIGSRFELIVLCYRHQLVVPATVAPPPGREVSRLVDPPPRASSATIRL
jgi:DNA-binding NarL/FixJ family response regulator